MLCKRRGLGILISTLFITLIILGVTIVSLIYRIEYDYVKKFDKNAVIYAKSTLLVNKVCNDSAFHVIIMDGYRMMIQNESDEEMYVILILDINPLFSLEYKLFFNLTSFFS